MALQARNALPKEHVFCFAEMLSESDPLDPLDPVTSSEVKCRCFPNRNPRTFRRGASTSYAAVWLREAL